MHLLFSLRENEHSLQRDLAKTQLLYDKMQYMNMESQDSPSVLYKWSKDEMIYNCDRDFSIYKLAGAYGLLDNLPRMCENYSNGCYRSCVVNRNQPMLKTKYMRFQIFTFRKVA